MTMIGRFAPSPSGRMHIGNLFAALLAWLDVRAAGGRLILRMEDLDPLRTGLAYARILADDLRWLGLDWEEGFEAGGAVGPYCQSERTAFYEAQYRQLEGKGLVYPCFCSRADRMAAAAPHPGEEAVAHPCPCRAMSRAQRAERTLVRSPAWKVMVPNEEITFADRVYGTTTQNLANTCGDFIIRRADGGYAYQLAVTADDGAMGVTNVVRGRDLLDSTSRQIWLMRLLGWTPPQYLHVPLLTAPDGRRLSKRERDLDLGALRENYAPQEIVGLLAHLAGLCADAEAKTARELIPLYDPSRIVQDNIVLNMTRYATD